MESPAAVSPRPHSALSTYRFTWRVGSEGIDHLVVAGDFSEACSISTDLMRRALAGRFEQARLNCTAPYVIQRQDSAEADWLPVTYCQSMAYAEIVAAAGLRRNLASSYRALHVETGAVGRLDPDVAGNAGREEMAARRGSGRDSV